MIGVSARTGFAAGSAGPSRTRPWSACARPSESARTSRAAPRAAPRVRSRPRRRVAERREHRAERDALGCVVVDDEDRRCADRAWQLAAPCSPSATRVRRPSAGVRPGATPRERSSRLAVSTGFATYAEAPASMQRWRSPAPTFAVTAMIGRSSPTKLAHRSHRRVAVHARHHDVDEHDVDVRRPLEDRDGLLAALGRDHRDVPTRSSSAVRAKMLTKSSSTTRAFLPARPAPVSIPGRAHHVGDDDLGSEPSSRCASVLVPP